MSCKPSHKSTCKTKKTAKKKRNREQSKSYYWAGDVYVSCGLLIASSLLSFSMTSSY